MKILDGSKYSKIILDDIKQKIRKLSIKPKLAIVLLGKNPSSITYIKSKEKACKYVGMDIEKHFHTLEFTEKDLIELINKLNKDRSVNGIIVQLPLPSNINTDNIIFNIDYKKDVDGFHPFNLGKIFVGLESLAPCTALGIVDLLSFYDIDIKGKTVCILGKSNIVGKPVALMLLNHKANVISCDKYTEDIIKLTQVADILISATGVPNLIKAKHIKKDAVIVDVGFTYKNGVLYGDVDEKSIKDKASYISPVPGGIGKMTVAHLIKNTYKAYMIQNNKKNFI